MKQALLLFIICTFISSCSENSNNVVDAKKFEKINKITDDAVFVNLLENTSGTMRQIKNPEFAQTLINKGKHITPEEVDKLAKAMGFENRKAFIQNYKDYKSSVEYLDNKYNFSSYDQEVIKTLVVESSDSMFEKDLSPSISDCSSNCKRIGRDKLAAAAGAAIGGHVACLAADLTVILGAVCHGSVTLAQLAVSDQAVAETEKCINECNKDEK